LVRWKDIGLAEVSEVHSFLCVLLSFFKLTIVKNTSCLLSILTIIHLLFCLSIVDVVGQGNYTGIMESGCNWIVSLSGPVLVNHCSFAKQIFLLVKVST